MQIGYVPQQPFGYEGFTVARALALQSHITSDFERVTSHLALMRKGELVLFKEMDSVREEVKLLTLAEGDSIADEVRVLNKQGNKVLVDNYSEERCPNMQAE